MAVGVYVRVEFGAAAPWLMLGAAAVWVVAAYRCGQDGWDANKQPAAPAAPADGEQPQDTAGTEAEPAAAPAPTGPRPSPPSRSSPRCAVSAPRTPS
ncbi:hypothetical protein GCM10017668_69310 [Streptomyces tuirus]|uniref:Uncharacterized protein n=1 Tax=Streptomyces tuirus TaxID=68278 RepID=A0A7G1NPF3_9ACTN|nr:hypothetical protein GCM10017668_69310 [Streptomyces tuirus]